MHKWETKRRFPCKVPLANNFTGTVYGKFAGEVEFQECKSEGCDKVRCIVSTGNESQQFPIGITARSVMDDIPKLLNDPYMIMLSKM